MVYAFHNSKLRAKLGLKPLQVGNDKEKPEGQCFDILLSWFSTFYSSQKLFYVIIQSQALNCVNIIVN